MSGEQICRGSQGASWIVLDGPRIARQSRRVLWWLVLSWKGSRGAVCRALERSVLARSGLSRQSRRGRSWSSEVGRVGARSGSAVKARRRQSWMGEALSGSRGSDRQGTARNGLVFYGQAVEAVKGWVSCSWVRQRRHKQRTPIGCRRSGF